MMRCDLPRKLHLEFLKPLAHQRPILILETRTHERRLILEIHSRSGWKLEVRLKAKVQGEARLMPVAGSACLEALTEPGPLTVEQEEEALVVKNPGGQLFESLTQWPIPEPIHHHEPPESFKLMEVRRAIDCTITDDHQPLFFEVSGGVLDIFHFRKSLQNPVWGVPIPKRTLIDLLGLFRDDEDVRIWPSNGRLLMAGEDKVVYFEPTTTVEPLARLLAIAVP